MSRYRVEWLEEALQELASIWIESRSLAITEASNRVEQRLGASQSPNKLGSPFGNDEGLRMLDEPPLRVIFSVNTSKQLVEIAAVIKSPTR